MGIKERIKGFVDDIREYDTQSIFNWLKIVVLIVLGILLMIYLVVKIMRGG